VLALELAQSDGDTAYACTLMGASTFAVWVTTDRSAHWTRASALPRSPTGPAGSQAQCALAVDTSNPRTVVASVSWQMPRQDQPSGRVAVYVTADGGGSWRNVGAGGPLAPGRLATYRGTTYAVDTGAWPPGTASGLWASSDALRTWRRVDGAVRADGNVVMGFWLDPDSGAILAQAWTLAGDPAPLWATRDGGARWTRLASRIPSQLAVRAVGPGGPWHICDLSQAISGQVVGPNRLTCSVDGGQTWMPAPTLNVTQVCHKCLTGGVPVNQVAPMTLVGIATDGAVLSLAATPPAGATPPPVEADTSARTLYRLAPGATTWRSLGVVPAGGMLYLPAASGAILWVIQEGFVTFTATYA
jgi:hypothetical protein